MKLAKKHLKSLVELELVCDTVLPRLKKPHGQVFSEKLTLVRKSHIVSFSMGCWAFTSVASTCPDKLSVHLDI